MATPLWFAWSDSGIYVVTHATAGKVKRIRNNPSVTVAPCRSQGKPTAPERPGRARLLEGAERRRALTAIGRRYFMVPASLIEFEMRRRGGGEPAMCFEITESNA